MKVTGNKSLTSFLNLITQFVWAVCLIVLIVYPLIFSLSILGHIPTIPLTIPIEVNLFPDSERVLQQYGGIQPGENPENFAFPNIIFSSSSDVTVSTMSEKVTSSWLYYLLFVVHLGLILAIFYGLTLVKRIFNNLIEENPWHEKHTKWIQSIGLIMILAVPYLYTLDWINFYLGQEFLFPSKVVINAPSMNISYGISGLIIILVAYLFNQANKIHEEQKLTV